MVNILSNIWCNVLHIVLELHLITKLIVYFNIIMWLLPPLKQFKGGYFFYFVILALTDPLTNILFKALNFNPFNIYIPSSAALLLVSLYYTNLHSKKILMIYLTSFVMLYALMMTHGDIKLKILIIIFMHINICIIFIHRFYQKYFDRNILYVYLLVLIFYEFTVVMKMFVFLFDINTGVIFVYGMNILEVFICFYFIFFNFKNGGKIRHNI